MQFKLLDKFKIPKRYKWDIFDKILKDIIEDFKKVLEISGDEQGHLLLRKHLLNRSFAYLGKLKEDNEAWRYVGVLESFVFEKFAYDFTEQIKEYINTKIQKAITPDTNPKSYNSDYSRYVVHMLDLLFRTEASENELHSYAERYWKEDEVRQWVISYYKSSGHRDKAIEVLEESLRLDWCHYRIWNYKKELKELYLLAGMTDKYAAMILEEIKGSNKAELERFRELKSISTPERWLEISEQIYTSKEGNNEILAQYFTEDKRFDKLYQLALKVWVVTTH